METELIRLYSDDLNTEPGRTALRRGAGLLREGQVVAFPTETVYGLGADGMDPRAAGKIYEAKGRPSDNPLILHIAWMSQVEQLAERISGDAWKLMEAFWPGPMTVILHKKPRVPKRTTGGLDTVAVRMPSHPVARALLRECGLFVAAPSANRSGRPSPTEAAHVMEDMAGRIPMVLDGGRVGIGIESTIIDMTGSHPVILRPGYLTPGMVEEVVPGVEADPAISKKRSAEEKKPRAPGMKYRHYAPKGDFLLVEGATDKMVPKINELAGQKRREGLRVGILGTDENRDAYQADVVRTMGSRKDPKSIGQNLYAALREMDEQGVQFICGEGFGGEDFYGAIRNRIRKAAGYRILKV